MSESTVTPNTDSIAAAIQVRVQVSYLPMQSKPNEGHFVYGYTITISNNSNGQVQLLNRHWLISDSEKIVKEVKGPGVVGEQPIIGPQACYTYSSGVVMETSTGSMEGSYEMTTKEGDRFEVPIPMFALVPPHLLH